MKWSEFFSQKFGIDANADMPNENEQSMNAGAENTTAINTSDIQTQHTTPPPAPSSDSNQDKSIDAYKAEIEALKKENASIKEANGKLLAGMSLTNENTSVEDDIFSLIYGNKEDKNGRNEIQRTGNMSATALR